MTYIKGLDLYHGDDIDVTKLPSDIGFVFLKLSQGATAHDNTFQDRYHALKTNRPEIIRLAYHYFDWTVDGGVQAQNFLNGGVNFTEAGVGPLAIDLEGDGSVADFVTNNTALCIQRVNDFISFVRSSPLYGRQEIIIYSFDYFVANNLRGHTWNDCLFWVSSVQSTPPPGVNGWKPTFWQYQTVPTDFDYFLGTQDELNTLANI